MIASLFAQIDGTARTINAIVLGLVAVAAGLALLTTWYWRKTDPNAEAKHERRRALQSAADADSTDRPGGGGEPRTAVPRDPTTVMDRGAILYSRPPAQADPTDRSAIDAAAGATSGPDESSVDGARTDTAGGVTPGIDEPADDGDLVIDLRESSVPTDASSGREDGMSFDEWLALAEEER